MTNLEKLNELLSALPESENIPRFRRQVPASLANIPFLKKWAQRTSGQQQYSEVHRLIHLDQHRFKEAYAA